MTKEDIIRKHFHGFSDEQWNELKTTFPYVEIPYIVDDALNSHLVPTYGKPSHMLPSTLEVYSDNEEENIELALLEAIWISRWTPNKQALHAVITTEEALQMVKDIYIELDKIGYEIRKK